MEKVGSQETCLHRVSHICFRGRAVEPQRAREAFRFLRFWNLPPHERRHVPCLLTESKVFCFLTEVIHAISETAGTRAGPKLDSAGYPPDSSRERSFRV